MSISWDKEQNDFIVCSRQNVVYHSGECYNKNFQPAIDYIKSEPQFKSLLKLDDQIFILRCEFLRKHKVPINPEFLNKVVIYDMEEVLIDPDTNDAQHTYLSYPEYAWYRNHFPKLLWLKADFIENPKDEELKKLAAGPSDYCDYREGIVLKNYDFRNKYGRIKWGKVISPVFDEKKALKTRPRPEPGDLEKGFVDKFVTPGYVEKEIHKIRDEDGEISIKNLGKIIGIVPHELFVDYMWKYLNKGNVGQFDFRAWRTLVVDKTREYALDYFNRSNDS